MTTWTAHRGQGLFCSHPACAREACPELPATFSELERTAPEFSRHTLLEHLRLHALAATDGPAPRCARHQPRTGPRTLCYRHRAAIGSLLRTLDKLAALRDARIGRALDRLAIATDHVFVAERAATASEFRRAQLQEKPRKGPPQGWGLGRDLLKHFHLPQDFLPARRDVWMPGSWKRKTRRDASLDALGTAWREERESWDRYHAALAPAVLAYQAALTETADAERTPEGVWRFEPSTAGGKRIIEADHALRGAEKTHVELRERAVRASAAYRALQQARRATLTSGKTVSLPRSGLSEFWTASAEALIHLFTPYIIRTLSRTRSRPQGLTAPSIARTVLASLEPSYHLDSDWTAVRDRIRKP